MDRTIYLYCSDETALPTTAVKRLTPRAWFYAQSRYEARRRLAEIESYRFGNGRAFGKAGVRKESARERNQVLAPSERLPEIHDIYFVAGH